MFIVKIRGIDKRITVNDSRGEKLQKDWLNGTLPERIKIGDGAYESKNIVGIINHDEEPTREKTKEHWIVVDDEGNSIFGYPHLSYESAQATLAFHNLSGYHTEKRE